MNEKVSSQSRVTPRSRGKCKKREGMSKLASCPNEPASAQPVFAANLLGSKQVFQLLQFSFIHTEYLYSASSRELLRGAPKGEEEQDQVSSARPWKQSYMKSAAQQGASIEYQACI